MIDWWGVLHNALWVAGLAIGLAALSLADYQAVRAGVRLRAKLGEAGVQMTLCLGMALFCLGLLFSGRWWWERAAWGLLAGLFGAQLAWLWWRGRAVRAAPTHHRGIAVAEPRRRGSRAVGWAGWGLVLAGLLVIAAWAAVTGARLLERARSLQSHLQSLEQVAQAGASELGPDSLSASGQHLAGMRQDLEAIQAQVGPLLPLGRLLRWVPKHGGDLAAASDLLAVAVRATSAGDRAFQALSPALGALGGAAGDPRAGLSPTERVVQTLVDARPAMLEVQEDLSAVEEARSRIDAESLSPQTAGLLARLDRYVPWFEVAAGGAVLAPDLLGAGGSRSYLVLAQNSDELRATGGFISGVGELTLVDGRVAALNLSDSYAVDNLAVPHDLTPPDFQRTLDGQLWFFRDTNWDADFPTSARRALAVYARDRGVQADGVVALDLTALQLLVGAVGPLRVEGVAEPVTGENVLPVMQAQWGQQGDQAQAWQEWWLHRKDFMGQIAGAVMDQLGTGQDLDALRLARALKQALDEKHLLVYVADPAAAGLLRELNWDGALQGLQAASDGLMVVDTNVGFNKADPNVERTIQYKVDLSDERQPRARLTLTYRNHSPTPVEECLQEARYGQTYADMTDRCYWDYLRVYVPAGSRLLSGPDLSLPAGSLLARSGNASAREPVTGTLAVGDWMVWTAFFDLAPGQERALTFEYQLPVEVLDHGADGTVRYRLRVQKQPGTEAVPLQIDVVLPTGAVVVDATPADLRIEPRLSTDLRTDREFELVYRTVGNP